MKSGNGSFRKRRLFPRSLQETLRDATRPMLDAQGKLYGSLLADWAQIMGPERARCMRPVKLHFPHRDRTTGGVLTIEIDAAQAAEAPYEAEIILAKLARHLGFKAIDRLQFTSRFTSKVAGDNRRETR